MSKGAWKPILDLLAAHPKGLRGQEVAILLDVRASEVARVKQQLVDVKKAGLLETEGIQGSREVRYKLVVRRQEEAQALAPPPAVALAAGPTSALEETLRPLIAHITQEVRAALLAREEKVHAALSRLVEGLAERLGALERDAGLLLENLTKPSAGGKGQATLGVADHTEPAASSPKPKRPRICIVGLEGTSGLIEREFPELDLRFIKADDKNRSGVEAVAAGSSEVILLTKFLPHTLTGKLAHKRTRRVEGMAGLREALREIAG